jgi:aspartyl/glutamyl-tRNA(Asn/Gln) amidotransferase C subunit
MATPDDIRKLAALSRVAIDDTRLESFTRECEAILGYVGQLESLRLPVLPVEKPPLRNVTREDREPHEPGVYTEALSAQFPEEHEGYLSVRQIISHGEPI